VSESLPADAAKQKKASDYVRRQCDVVRSIVRLASLMASTPSLLVRAARVASLRVLATAVHNSVLVSGVRVIGHNENILLKFNGISKDKLFQFFLLNNIR